MISLFVFVLQIFLFGGITLYLHYLSEHYGFAPLLFFVAGCMGVLNLVEIMTFAVKPAPDIILRPGGHVFVPVILLIILIVYISSGTRTARLTIIGLIGIDLLIFSVLLFLLLYLNIHEASTTIQGVLADTEILTPLFFRGIFASMFTFSANMFVIVIIYQGIKNAFPAFPESFIPGVALIIALWVDAILYNALAFFGTSLYVPGIPSDILIKTLAGVLLAPLAGWYLTRIAPNLTHHVGASQRPTLGILFGENQFASRLFQLESELKVSRAIYGQIVQHIGEIFWLVDVKKKRLLYLSPNFEKITGRPRDVYYRDPKALIHLVHPDDHASTIVGKLFLTSETEFRILKSDGSVCWLRNRAFPILTQDQEVVRYAGIIEDITLRRESQAQTFALELSREKVKMLHQFVRDASHDLRTPLSSLLLKLDLLDRVDADRQIKLKQELRTTVRQLNNLIDDLFALSRIESEDQNTPHMVDFNEIVQQVGDQHQVIAQDKNLDFRLDLTDAAALMIGDREQLFRLITNLIGNAIHYTHEGAITVTTRITDDQAVILEVVDTGIGVPKAHLNAIFDPFYRTDQARTMRQEGTGLGLAISKAIVEQHQGTITVESREGCGTTFQVKFPLNSSLQANSDQDE